jgi:phytoene dehydrogenase-like protein
LANSIEQRYRRLGGEITYNARVTKVLVEDDRAVGVLLSDGREVRADIVVSACDGPTTMLTLIDDRYLTDTYRRLYTTTIAKPGMVFPGYFCLFLGLNRTFPEADPCTTYLLDEPERARLVGIRHPSINVQFRSTYYPELNREGTSVVYATYFSDIGPWRALNQGPERLTRVREGREVHTLPVRHGRDYYAAKRQVAKAITALLDRRVPGLADAVVRRDSATPLTQVRYTGNYDGTTLGWQPFVEGGETMEEEVKKYGPALPGLKNFYISGVWATTGGLIRAAAAGRQVTQFICRDDGKPFTASIDDTAPPPTHTVIPVGPATGRGRNRGEASGGRGGQLVPDIPNRGGVHAG